MYQSGLHQPVSGLSQALAFNAAELDKQQASLQARAVLRPLGGGSPALAAPPVAYDAQPEAAAWQRNTEAFMRLLNSPAKSANPYNDHRYFAQVPVLRSGWADAPAVARFVADKSQWAAGHETGGWLVAPGRSGGGPLNQGLVKRFRLLLEVSGFDKRFPVLLDRDGRVLDGWHRLLACAQMESRYFFLQLDF